MNSTEITQNLTALIGNTPLLRLDRIGGGLSATLVAKLEFFNPGGSVKDRAALFILEAAEKAGLELYRMDYRRIAESVLRNYIRRKTGKK